MKKILTLFMTVCMLIACFVPTGAVSYDLETVQLGYELGTPTAEYDFAETEGSFYDNRKGNSGSTITYNGELLVNKPEDVNEQIDLRNSDINAKSAYMLFSFKLKTVNAGTVKIGLGRAWADDENLLTVEKYSTALAEYTTFNILTDAANSKYSVWVGDKNVFVDAPDIDGVAFKNPYDTEKGITHLRIWTTKNTDAINVYLDDFSVTPLVAKTSKASGMPSDKTENLAWNEDFDDFTVGAYDATNTYWKAYLDTKVFNTTTSTNAQKSNVGDMSIGIDATGDNRLEVTYDAGQYHNWYYNKASNYVSANDSSANCVIQMDIKADGSANIFLGRRADSAIPVALWATADGIANASGGSAVTTKTFVHSENFDTAEYSKITFLLHKTARKYSAWIDNICIVRNANFSGANDVDSLNFKIIASGKKMYVDNIKVYTAADDDFLKIYNLVNEINAGTKDVVTTDGDGNIVFADKDALGTSAEVSYSDSKGYIKGAGIEYPLFAADTTNVRVTVKSGNVKDAVEVKNINVPTAYTFGEGAAFTKNGTKYEISLPVSLRNAASDGKLFIVTAVYDENECKKVSIKEDAFANYNGGTFDASIELGETTISENAKVKVFFWEKGTLTPLMVYEK